MELAQQMYSCQSKNHPKAPNFSLSTYLAHVISTSQNTDERKRGRMGLIPGSRENHSLVLLFILHGCAGRQHHCPGYICCKRRCLATAINVGFPLYYFPEDWNTAPRYYLQAPSVWLTTYVYSFFSWFKKKKSWTKNPRMKGEETLEQHRVLWGLFDEEKFFDSSLTLFAIYSFILPF